MGLRLSKLTPELRRRYQIDVGVDGVVITGIAGTSPALGHVMEGDVITEVGSAKVMTPDQVRKEVGAAKQTEKKVVLMKVNHAGESGYRGIRLDEK
jgi:serine protease Do